jgi:hypothetical protein
VSESKKVDLTRFTKNQKGEKEETKVTSVNIFERQHEFVERKNLNLSKIIREYLDELMRQDEDKPA